MATDQEQPGSADAIARISETMLQVNNGYETGDVQEVAKKNTEQDRKAAYVRDASLLFDLDKSKLFAKLPQMISFRTNQYICSACRGLEFPTLSPWLQPDQATNQGAHFLRCDQLGQALKSIIPRSRRMAAANASG